MRIDRGTKLIHEQYFQFYLMKNVRNNDSAFFFSSKRKKLYETMSVPNNTKCLLWKPLSHNNSTIRQKRENTYTIVNMYVGNT